MPWHRCCGVTGAADDFPGFPMIYLGIMVEPGDFSYFFSCLFDLFFGHLPLNPLRQSTMLIANYVDNHSRVTIVVEAHTGNSNANYINVQFLHYTKIKSKMYTKNPPWVIMSLCRKLANRWLTSFPIGTNSSCSEWCPAKCIIPSTAFPAPQIEGLDPQQHRCWNPWSIGDGHAKPKVPGNWWLIVGILKCL